MEEKIKAKLNEIRQNFPSNVQFKQWLLTSNLWNWIYSSFKCQGQNVTKSMVVDLVDGKLIDDIPLNCYSFVQGLKDVYKDMQAEINMQSDINLKLFVRWGELLGISTKRKSNPVVYEYGIIPCHFNSIDEELALAFKKYSLSSRTIADAADLFLSVIRIYPYDEDSIDMAFVAISYVLMLCGYPLPELLISEGEFENMIKEYMNDNNCAAVYSLFERCVYNRLDTVLMLEKQAKEQEK